MFSFNTQRISDEEIAKIYYEKGLKALSVNDYVDSLIYFSKARSISPVSDYGELSYLYYGLTYALYSYHVGSKEGVLSAIGYLNLYTFYYKKPKYFDLKQEFLGDSYFLIGWYENAMNLYSSLYGSKKDPRYLLKYSFTSAVYGDYTGYNYLNTLRETPKEYEYLYYLTLGIYETDFGHYRKAIHYLNKAYSLNPFLKFDVHYNYYAGVALFKEGDIRRSLMHFIRTRELDKFNFYTTMTNYYLTRVYLNFNDFSGAFDIYKEIRGELFYNPIYQIIYLNYWTNKEFLKRFKEFKFYYDVVLQLAWLNSDNRIGNYALLALYDGIINKKINLKEVKDFLKVFNFKEGEFVLNGEIFSYDNQVKLLNEEFQKLKDYKDADVIISLYKTNRRNFLSVFKDDNSIELLARALVYRADDEFLKVVNIVSKRSVKKFLKAKYWFVKGNREVSQRLLKESLYKLEGLDELEAYLLYYYLSKSPYIDEVLYLSEEYEPLRGYFPHAYRVAGDIYFEKEMCNKAEEMYKRFLKEYKIKDDLYALTLVKLGECAEKERDKEGMEFVLKEAKSFKNTVGRAILSLWGGG